MSALLKDIVKNLLTVGIVLGLGIVFGIGVAIGFHAKAIYIVVEEGMEP